MKSFTRRNFIKTAAAGAIALSIDNFATATNTNLLHKLSLEDLVFYYINSFPTKEIAENYLDAYKSMSYEEFEKFDDLLIENIFKDDSIMKETNQDNILLSLEFRLDLNRLSYKQYSRSFNQISASELNDLIANLWYSGYKDKVAQLLGPSACICPIYPVITIPAGATVYPHNSQGRQRAANSANCNDCDLEVWFPFNQDRLEWVSGAGGIY